MSKIQKTWGEVVASYNIATQIVTNATQQLQSIKHLERSDKSKEELKKQIEENAKSKPLYIEMERVYSAYLKNLEDTVQKHRDRVDEILIDNALEEEISPAKDGKSAVMRLLLNDKGEYCYDREGEKNKAKAIKNLNAETVMVPQLEIATTLTEKHGIFEGFIIFQKYVDKNRPPLKSVPKKK